MEYIEVAKLASAIFIMAILGFYLLKKMGEI